MTTDPKDKKIKILQSIVAGFVIAGGALILYQPFKDSVEIKGDIALQKAELAQIQAKLEGAKLEATNLSLKQENERLAQEAALLESEYEKNAKSLEDLQNKRDATVSQYQTNIAELVEEKTRLEEIIAQKSKYFSLHGIWYGQLEGDKEYKFIITADQDGLSLKPPTFSKIASVSDVSFEEDALAFTYETLGSATVKVKLNRISDFEFIGVADHPTKGILPYKLARERFEGQGTDGNRSSN